MEDNKPDWLPHDWAMLETLDGTRYLDPDGNQYTEADAHKVFHWSEGEPEPEPSKAVTTYQSPAPIQLWQDSEPELLQTALKRRTENRANLREWIQNALVEGTDYGRIHTVGKNKCKLGANCTDPFHWSKPCLWKAGAEKIVGMLGLMAHWPDLDDQRARLLDGNQHIVLRCLLLNPDGQSISEGIGGRSLDQDYGVMNKALKMAKKSALIDAVLNACGLSEVFTQDLVDDDSPGEKSNLDEDGVRHLRAVARELFGDQGDQVIESLCRRRFHIDDGDPYQIPAFRLQDAIRSLEQKAADEGGADE